GDLGGGPASGNDCGFTAITSASTGPASFGLSRMPLAAIALISVDGAGSITTARLGSRPPASQPVSIAPPILPAPASAMVPEMFCKPFIGALPVIAGLDPAIHRRKKLFLDFRWMRGSSPRMTSGPNYASPSVSNIDALIASASVLPAHTTNWNDGK